MSENPFANLSDLPILESGPVFDQRGYMQRVQRISQEQWLRPGQVNASSVYPDYGKIIPESSSKIKSRDRNTFNTIKEKYNFCCRVVNDGQVYTSCDGMARRLGASYSWTSGRNISVAELIEPFRIIASSKNFTLPGGDIILLIESTLTTRQYLIGENGVQYI